MKGSPRQRDGEARSHRDKGFTTARCSPRLSTVLCFSTVDDGGVSCQGELLQLERIVIRAFILAVLSWQLASIQSLGSSRLQPYSGTLQNTVDPHDRIDMHRQIQAAGSVKIASNHGHSAKLWFTLSPLTCSSPCCLFFTRPGVRIIRQSRPDPGQ